MTISEKQKKTPKLKTPRKKRQFLENEKKTPKLKTPIFENAQKNVKKKRLRQGGDFFIF